MKISIYSISILFLFSIPLVSNSQKVFQIATDGESLLANTGKSLALITNQGNTIQEIVTPTITPNENMLLDISGNTFITSHYNYCQISLDKGVTWKKIIIPEKTPIIHSLNIIESTIYIGANSNLYFSNNNGETWEKASGIKKSEILCVSSKGNILYAGGKETDDYVPVFYISTDNGQNWEKFIKGLEGQAVEKIVTNENAVLVSTKYYDAKLGVFAFDETEKKWNSITDKKLFGSNVIGSIAISDTNYVISIKAANYLVSNDKGKNWKTVTTTFTIQEFHGGLNLVYIPKEKNSKTGILYSLNLTGSLYLSNDNGANWVKCKFQADSDKAIADAAQVEKDKENAKLAKQKAYRDSVATVTEFRKNNEKTLKNYFQGIGEMSYSNYDSALVKFNKAILAKPDFTEAFEARAKCFKAMNQPENAKKDSITAGGLTPDVKANSLFANHFKSAEVEANTVGSVLYTECYYKDANGWYLRAKKDYSSDAQLKFMWKATELDATKAEYWIFLGDISRDNNYPVAADTHYNRAMKANPNCEWYDHDVTRMVTCGNCNGKGYRLQVNITQQKVNNTTHSTSDSEKKPCTECYQGYVKVVEKFPSVRLVK